MRISLIGSSRNAHLNRGFSLIELLVVLVIMTTITSIVVVSFSSQLSSLKLKYQVRNILSSIQKTRLDAIKSGHETLWTLDLDSRRYWSAQHKKNTYPSALKVVMDTASRERISSTKARIRFFPNGASTGAKVLISNERSTYVINVDWLTGLASIVDS